MLAIKNVAVVGASGNLGQTLVQELQAAGFNVTALTRETSSATFPPGVQVKKVNYESNDSLKSALAGQDAVVSTTASVAVGNQIRIVDAALAAGVKRFIPSEFGINTRTVTHPKLKALLRGKIETLDYIIEKTTEYPSFTWTGLTNGLFFDWGFKFTGLGFNKDQKVYNVVDSGNERFNVSSLPFIGKAVAAVLSHPEKSANQYLAIASFTLTQNQLLGFVEEISGEKWGCHHVKAADLDKKGDEKLSKGDYSSFSDFLQAYIYGDGSDNKADDSANMLLDLQAEDPRPTIKAWLAGKL